MNTLKANCDSWTSWTRGWLEARQVVGFPLPIRGGKIIFHFFAPEQRQSAVLHSASTRNPSRIRRKIKQGNESVLKLGSQVPFAYTIMCGIKLKKKLILQKTTNYYIVIENFKHCISKTCIVTMGYKKFYMFPFSVLNSSWRNAGAVWTRSKILQLIVNEIKHLRGLLVLYGRSFLFTMSF